MLHTLRIAYITFQVSLSQKKNFVWSDSCKNLWWVSWRRQAQWRVLVEGEETRKTMVGEFRYWTQRLLAEIQESNVYENFTERYITRAQQSCKIRVSTSR